MAHFTKLNQTAYPNALECEAQGLEILRDQLKPLADAFIQIPKVHSVSAQELVIEEIKSTSATSQQWYRFGQGLAQLHQIPQHNYGFEVDNYIGLNPQKNMLSSNWGEFLFEYRLMAQVDFIKDKKIKAEFSNALRQKKSQLIDFLNQNCQHPSLVHGDLWSGNLLFDSDNVWLIDPAVYYGDREVDIAMTEMFGGFSSEFYQGYDSVYPRSSEYGKKKQIYNLYHFLNHYNLFGGGYLASCKKLLGEIASNL
ncbi:MAG: fructosamine kinase family protein [Gammaproteobacteria bacterium]|nr:fructosamine kinase family protein [Gammaproteobacteria bacterium]